MIHSTLGCPIWGGLPEQIRDGSSIGRACTGEPDRMGDGAFEPSLSRHAERRYVFVFKVYIDSPERRALGSVANWECTPARDGNGGSSPLRATGAVRCNAQVWVFFITVRRRYRRKAFRLMLAMKEVFESLHFCMDGFAESQIARRKKAFESSNLSRATDMMVMKKQKQR